MMHTVQLAVSWALLSLIWLIQLMHYPAFRFVSADRFVAFHRHHTLAISVIAMPLMLLELAVTTAFWLSNPVAPVLLSSFLIVLVIWASTFLVQVPLHRALAAGKDRAKIDRLIRTNWLRTALWSLKAVLVTWDYL